jgi:hypothetical protein
VWVAASTGSALSAPVEKVNGGIGPAGAATVPIDTAVGSSQTRYRLVNVAARTCATAGATGSLTGQPCAGDPAQYFTVERRGAQYVSVHPVTAPGSCIDINYAVTDDSTPIGIVGCHGVATATYQLAQYWTIEYLTGPTSAAIVRLTTPLSGKCFDLSYGSATPGAAIWEWTCNGGTPQQWLLQPVTA